jgi:polyribonucleotide nucleotidyltransferase
MRMIDRPIRPLFPAGYREEVQVQILVLSADQENDPDLLGMIGASACLSISDIPFNGPIGAVRLGFVDNEMVTNPTHSQLESSELDMVVSGGIDSVNMIELESQEVSEEKVAQAVLQGHEVIKQLVEMQTELVGQCGKSKKEVTPVFSEDLLVMVRDKVADKIREAKTNAEKAKRNEAVEALRAELVKELAPEDVVGPYQASQVSAAFSKVEEEVVRRLILAGVRVDGRGPEDIREITCEVSVLPRTHGSALFSRGETQALTSITLGTPSDEQKVDGLMEAYTKKFMLHYMMPPFAVGEVRPIRGSSRRDIGHGVLAEKSLIPILPTAEQFPYTIRVTSDILASNGSSSMATVCGATLALMDAGVPVKDPVAGISIGLVREEGREVLLTDILGEEDHFGDMDFKVAGTQNGITGIQLDLKIGGLSHDLIVAALARAKAARLEILRKILATIDAPRPAISQHAPRILMVRIDPEKIGKVIGPAGKTIKKLQADYGVTIDIEDDGSVVISGMDSEAAEKAKETIQAMTAEAQVGRIYDGRVMSVKDFGAFVEILPGQDGLCHISELDESYVTNVADVCKMGDSMRVKVIAVDDQGRIKLSRKAAMREEQSSQ